MRKQIVTVALLALSSVVFAAENQAREILEKSIQATSKSKGCEYLMKGYERIKGKPGLVLNEIFTKVTYSPLKIYAKVQSDPNKGTELLYSKGAHGDKIRVNAGKFLPTLSLHPYSSMLTKDQHHTLLSSGFLFYTRLIREGIKRADTNGKFDEVFKYDGEVIYKDKKCYKITIEDPTFAYTTVTTQANDNLYSVTQRLLVPECLVVEQNPSVKNFESDLSNKQLRIPTSYAKKSTIYIDKETLYPIFQEMSDDKGGFERYEYSNLKINPNFAADEFTESFSGYGF